VFRDRLVVDHVDDRRLDAVEEMRHRARRVVPVDHVQVTRRHGPVQIAVESVAVRSVETGEPGDRAVDAAFGGVLGRDPLGLREHGRLLRRRIDSGGLIDPPPVVIAVDARRGGVDESLRWRLPGGEGVDSRLQSVDVHLAGGVGPAPAGGGSEDEPIDVGDRRERSGVGHVGLDRRRAGRFDCREIRPPDADHLVGGREPAGEFEPDVATAQDSDSHLRVLGPALVYPCRGVTATGRSRDSDRLRLNRRVKQRELAQRHRKPALDLRLHLARLETVAGVGGQRLHVEDGL